MIDYVATSRLQVSRVASTSMLDFWTSAREVAAHIWSSSVKWQELMSIQELCLGRMAPKIGRHKPARDKGHRGVGL